MLINVVLIKKPCIYSDKSGNPPVVILDESRSLYGVHLHVECLFFALISQSFVSSVALGGWTFSFSPYRCCSKAARWVWSLSSSYRCSCSSSSVLAMFLPRTQSLNWRQKLLGFLFVRLIGQLLLLKKILDLILMIIMTLFLWNHLIRSPSQ